MKKSLKIALACICLFPIIYITGCNKLATLGHDKQIKENIHNSLSIYPMKNLEKIYDIKGAENIHFKENDKGTWIFDSSMQTMKNNTLRSEMQFYT